MALSKHQSERAHAMAEAWAKDPQRLAGLLFEEMDTEHWSRICAAISKQITAITDNTSHEQCLRTLLVEANEISGVIVEIVFLPIAERMVKKADAGFNLAKPIREEQLLQEAA